MRFVIDAKDEFMPSVPPTGGSSARQSPSTQVRVRLVEWLGDVFRVWLPESAGDIWYNHTPGLAHQDFIGTETAGLVWRWQGHPSANLETEVTPQGDSLLLEARVTNRSHAPLENVRASHCLQFSQAPHFACGDFLRIYIRADGHWQTLAALRPKTDYPHFFRAGLREAGNLGDWETRRAHLHESIAADHPLIVCVSDDGARAVGTASEDYRFLFHNHANAHLWCIHSQQSPAPVLAPHETVCFRQKVYFSDQGLEGCVAAFEADAGEHR